MTITATAKHRAWGGDELRALQRIQENREQSFSLVLLFDQFDIDGLGGPHLCFVLTLLGEDVVSFGRTAPTKVLRPYIVKTIVQCAIEAVFSLHSWDIIHTSGSIHSWLRSIMLINMADVKGAKVLRIIPGEQERVVEYLATNPPEIIGEFEHRGKRRFVYNSQPIRLHGVLPGWDMSHMCSEGECYSLIDMGHGTQFCWERAKLKLTSPCSPVGWRATEHRQSWICGTSNS